MSSYVDLNAPMDSDRVRQLKVGDLVTISGTIYGIRDATHRKMFDEGVDPPVSFKNQVVLHTAPSVRRLDAGKYEVLSTGPTTSTRVERYIPEMIRKLGVTAIMGKGGLYRKETLDSMKDYGCVYLGMIGGAGALTTASIKEVLDVYWEDLFPECIWKFRVERMGPLIVGLDSHGRNLYADVKNESQNKIDAILGRRH